MDQQQQQSNMSFTQNVDALFSNIEDFTRKECMLGKPLTHGNKTLIPVVSVMLGYGSGTTPSKSQQNNADTAGDTGAGMSSGTGIGLGARIMTEAIVVIDEDNVSMLPVNDKANMGNLMDKLPQMLSGLNLGGQQGQKGQQSQSGQSNQQSQSSSQGQGSQRQ